MSQIKVIKGNLNNKDRARNMRGIKKYEDKINFIIKNNIDASNTGDKKTFKHRIASIKGDKEFSKFIQDKKDSGKYFEDKKEDEDIINRESTNKIEGQEELGENKHDDSMYDDESEVKVEDPYLVKKLKDYIPKTDSEIKEFCKKYNLKKGFDIIFENERVIIIDKPAGIMVHPDDRSTEVTVSDMNYNLYPNMRDVGEGDRFGIVHRLDRNTTGVLVLCKTRDAHHDTKNVFKTHKIRKVYRAIVEGNVRDDMGVIDKPMARTRSDFRKKGVVDMFSKDFRGAERSAITRYKVLARSEDKKMTYVELYPLTGRTHQLRVHMRSIRHPIIGDDLYGSEKGATLAGRSMLHAYKIEFTLRKQEVKATANVPKDMQEIIDKNFKM